MKPPLFPKNTAINQERIERIEKVITRLTYRTKKSDKAIITPYPISNAIVGENLVGGCLEGVILRYLFPCEGKITKGYIKLDKRPKDGVNIDVRIFNGAKSESKGFTVSTKTVAIDTALDVSPGDCLEVTLTPLSEKSDVKEIWISMLWVPTTGDIQKFMVDNLEKQLEDFIEEVNEE